MYDACVCGGNISAGTWNTTHATGIWTEFQFIYLIREIGKAFYFFFLSFICYFIHGVCCMKWIRYGCRLRMIWVNIGYVTCDIKHYQLFAFVFNVYFHGGMQTNGIEWRLAVCYVSRLQIHHKLLLYAYTLCCLAIFCSTANISGCVSTRTQCSCEN